MLDILVRHGQVTPAVAQNVRAFIAANQTSVPAAGAAAAAAPSAPKFKRCALHPTCLGMHTRLPLIEYAMLRTVI